MQIFLDFLVFQVNGLPHLDFRTFEPMPPHLPGQVKPLPRQQFLDGLGDRVLQFAVVGHKPSRVVDGFGQIENRIPALQHVEVHQIIANGSRAAFAVQKILSEQSLQLTDHRLHVIVL